MKRTPLTRGKPLERKSTLERGNGLQRKANPAEASTVAQKRRPVSPASRAQRNKVQAEGKCRVCGIPDTVATLDPAHVADRSIGGCDQPDCTIPLCRAVCHPAYDEHRLDLLPYATKAEQAHAVSHLGIAAAFKRITNDREAA